MTNSKKIPILVISYLFPPRGGVGVQRIAKFVKYLPENGFKPIVLTVKKPSGSVPEDKALLDEISPDVEIIRTKSYEPYHIYRAVGGRRAQDDPSFRGELVDKGTKKDSLNLPSYYNRKRYSITHSPLSKPRLFSKLKISSISLAVKEKARSLPLAHVTEGGAERLILAI